MKAKADKEIEKLIDKMMKETTLESPSFDFTAQVMSQVLKIKTNKVTVYKPLISKWIWYGIFISMLGLIAYLSFNDSVVTDGLLEKYNFEILPKFSISNIFSGLHFSRTTLYACILLTVMLFIQIPILKHHMDKRLEV
ncbi:MAG TPA: hypothetical protein VIS27_00295 [Yeosuana sp.]